MEMVVKLMNSNEHTVGTLETVTPFTIFLKCKRRRCMNLHSVLRD